MEQLSGLWPSMSVVGRTETAWTEHSWPKVTARKQTQFTQSISLSPVSMGPGRGYTTTHYMTCRCGSRSSYVDLTGHSSVPVQFLLASVTEDVHRGTAKR